VGLGVGEIVFILKRDSLDQTNGLLAFVDDGREFEIVRAETKLARVSSGGPYAQGTPPRRSRVPFCALKRPATRFPQLSCA
jgi:hypothetical protein